MRMILLLGLVAGCRSTGERCNDVYMQSIRARIYEGADSTERVRIGPLPPPRPSDAAWYAEHCFEGRAR